MEYKAGQVRHDGDIERDPLMAGMPCAVRTGIVYIEHSELSKALAAGWQQYSEVAPNGLVRVRRDIAPPFSHYDKFALVG